MFTHIQAISESSRKALQYALESQEGLQRGELARLTGPAIFLNQVSGNGRKYIAESVHQQVADLQSRIEKKALFGELDHPPVNDLARLAYVQMQNVSHRIDALWYDKAKDAYMITITVLDTPSGRILKAIIDAGSPIYVSLRSLLDPARNIQRDGYIEAYIMALITIDCVSRPGFADAELEPIDIAANEAALAVCESLNLFQNMNRKTNQRNLSMAFESLAGIAVEPTGDFKTTVNAFMADVIDKFPSGFSSSDFLTQYPSLTFGSNVIGLNEDANELLIEDTDTNTIATIKLSSDCDDEYCIGDDAEIRYFDSEVSQQSANEGMYAIVSTENYSPSEDFVAQAENVAQMLADAYGNGFSMDDFNTTISEQLANDFGMLGRIDDGKLCIISEDGGDAACISLSEDNDLFVPGEISEFYNPDEYDEDDEDDEDDKDAEECDNAEYKATEMFVIDGEEPANENLPIATIEDEEPANENLEGVQQQTYGNQNNPLPINQNYMKTENGTGKSLEQAVILDENDSELEQANVAKVNKVFTIVDENQPKVTAPERPSDDKDTKDKDTKDKDADDYNYNELATEAQKIFGMPSSKFAGNYAIEHMPMAYKHIWGGLSPEAKETFAMQAKHANIATESDNLKFWSNTNFVAIERACIAAKGTVSVALENLTAPDPKITFLGGLMAGVHI